MISAILISRNEFLIVLQIGLLGKANVGKSTFFSAATETSVPSGNFPFTTIEPNIGVAFVTSDCACKHFEIKHDNELCVNGTRFIPIKLIDVAGLVPGAHEGKGLGNQFLDDARQAEVLIHVVDIAGTTDIQGKPVPVGTHDPLEDIAFVQDEFDQWFSDILKREWDKITREIDQKRAKLTDGIAKRFSGLGIKDYQVQDILQKSGLISRNPKEWNDSDIQTFAKELRKNTKPMIIAANKADLCQDLDVITKISENVIPCSAETELLLRKASKAGIVNYSPGDKGFTISEGKEILPPQQKALDVVKSVFSKISSTGIQEILNKAVFDSLNFIVVYPVEDETKLINKDGVIFPDTKLLPHDSTAKDLAGLIHADIAKGFLHAIDCKTKQRISGEQKLKNGDVIKIVSTLSRG
jgi:ribosome-binding ATPase